MFRNLKTLDLSSNCLISFDDLIPLAQLQYLIAVSMTFLVHICCVIFSLTSFRSNSAAMLVLSLSKMSGVEKVGKMVDHGTNGTPPVTIPPDRGNHETMHF